jgi:iron(II)-dependent oxidoreductase
VPDTARNPRSPEPVGNHSVGASPLGINDLVGNVWQMTDSFCDFVACAVVLRGGSLYQPPSSYYMPQAQDNYHHVKLPYYDDSSVRSAYVGFRCVADTPLSLTSSHARTPISPV